MPTVDAEIVGTMIAGIVRYEWRGGTVARVSGVVVSVAHGLAQRDAPTSIYMGGLALRVIDTDVAADAYYVMRAGFAAECVAIAWRALRAVERHYRRALVALVGILPGVEIPEEMIPQRGTIRRRRKGGQ